MAMWALLSSGAAASVEHKLPHFTLEFHGREQEIAAHGVLPKVCPQAHRPVSVHYRNESTQTRCLSEGRRLDIVLSLATETLEELETGIVKLLQFPTLGSRAPCIVVGTRRITARDLFNASKFVDVAIEVGDARGSDRRSILGAL